MEKGFIRGNKLNIETGKSIRLEDTHPNQPDRKIMEQDEIIEDIYCLSTSGTQQ